MYSTDRIFIKEIIRKASEIISQLSSLRKEGKSTPIDYDLLNEKGNEDKVVAGAGNKITSVCIKDFGYVTVGDKLLHDIHHILRVLRFENFGLGGFWIIFCLNEIDSITYRFFVDTDGRIDGELFKDVFSKVTAREKVTEKASHTKIATEHNSFYVDNRILDSIWIKDFGQIAVGDTLHHVSIGMVDVAKIRNSGDRRVWMVCDCGDRSFGFLIYNDGTIDGKPFSEMFKKAVNYNRQKEQREKCQIISFSNNGRQPALGGKKFDYNFSYNIDYVRGDFVCTDNDIVKERCSLEQLIKASMEPYPIVAIKQIRTDREIIELGGNVFFNRVPYMVSKITMEERKSGDGYIDVICVYIGSELLMNIPYNMTKPSDFVKPNMEDTGTMLIYPNSAGYMQVNKDASTIMDRIPPTKEKSVFTTEDGVVILDDNQVVYSVLIGYNWPTRDQQAGKLWQPLTKCSPWNNWKHFSTNEARIMYIFENQPVYSRKDMDKYRDGDTRYKNRKL